MGSQEERIQDGDNGEAYRGPFQGCWSCGSVEVFWRTREMLAHKYDAKSYNFVDSQKQEENDKLNARANREAFEVALKAHGCLPVLDGTP